MSFIVFAALVFVGWAWLDWVGGLHFFSFSSSLVHGSRPKASGEDNTPCVAKYISP